MEPSTTQLERALGEPEEELHRTAIFSIRLQFFSAAALTLLIFFFAGIFSSKMPLLPLMALSAWVVLYTLVISYIAVAGSAYWLEKGRLLRLGLVGFKSGGHGGSGITHDVRYC